MKKPVIALIALVIAAGASTGGFLAVKNKNDKEIQKQNEQLAENQLFNIDSDSMTNMVIDCKDGKYTAEYIDDTWTLTDSPDGGIFPLSYSKMQAICADFADLTADDNYGPADEESKKRYGLDAPYAITITANSKEYKLYIGSKSPTDNYYYAMVEGKNNIYTIPAGDAESILSDFSTLKSPDLLNFKEQDLKSIKVIRDGKEAYEITFDKTTGLWALPEEYSMLTFDQAKAANMVSPMVKKEAQAVLENNLEDLSAYGFDKPVAEAVFTDINGREQHILISDFGNDRNTYTYVLQTDSNQVETFYTGDLSFLNYNIFDFVLKNVESANLYAINSFEFSCDGAEDSFTCNMNEKTAECRGQSIDLSNAEISSSFENFYNSFAYITIDSMDVKAKPELKDPIFTSVFTSEDGEKKIQLVDSDESGHAYLFIDGKYTGTLTSTDFINGPDSFVNAYKTFCKLAGLEPNIK